MLKFLRKYNKWILVVGGSLLMVAFLAPGAIQNCGFNPAKRTVARMEGHKVTGGEFDIARRQFAALQDFFPVTVNPNIIGGEDQVAHWLLLGHAAREGGFVGEKADGLEWATGELAQLVGRDRVNAMLFQQMGGNQQLLQFYLNQPQFRAQYAQSIQAAAAEFAQDFEQRHDQYAGIVGLTPGQLDEALSTTRGIWRMIDSHLAAARMSDRRAIAYSDAHRDEAYVDVAFIPPAAVIDEVAEPTEEQIIAQFEAYKDNRPSEGEYGVGYTLPPRVKLIYLTIDRAAVADQIRLDPVEVNKHWSQNRPLFPGDYPSERERVEMVLTNRVVENIKSLAHEVVQREVAKATSRLDTADGYKVLPDDWEQTRPRLEAIAPLIVEHVRDGTRGEIIRNPDEGITIPLPEVTVLGADFLTRSDLQALPGIGRARTQVGPRVVPFSEIALGVRELADNSQDLFLQVDVPMSEIRLDDTTGNRYYVTITDVRPESPPDSIDELRDEIIQDVKEIEAYRILEGRLDELRTLAVDDSLQALVDLFAPEPSEDPEAPAPPSPVRLSERVLVGEFGMRPSSPDINQETLREGVLDIAENLDPLTPVDETPLAARTVSVTAPNSRGVVIAQVVGLSPLTIETYRTVAESDVREALGSEFSEVTPDLEIMPFSFDALADRYRFKYTSQRDQELEQDLAEKVEDAEG